MEKTLNDLLAGCPVLARVDAASTIGVAEILCCELVAAGLLDESLREAAVDAIRRRECEGGTTALSCGIVIPHARMEEITAHKLAIATTRAGLDCGAADAQPSRIFIMILNPLGDAAGHVKILSALNRRLLRPEIRERVMLAETGEEIRRLLAES